MHLRDALRLGGAIVVAAFWAIAAGQSASASVYTWSDSATTWATASDWTPGGGPPGGGDVAKFANMASYANAPNIAASTSVGGLWVTGAAPLTIARSGFSTTLTLNGATINGNAATGIEMDPGAGPLTFSTYLSLAAPQTWLNNSSNLLTASVIYNNGNSLTIAGGGNVAIGGAISGGGALVQNSGFLALSAEQLLHGGATVNGGTLALGPATGSYQNGIIQGNLTINSGATVTADANRGAWEGAGVPGVSAIAINGGVLAFNDDAAWNPGGNGGLSAAAVSMTGGTISGDAAWYNGITSTPTLNTNASTATAVISGGLNLRLSGAGVLTFNVAQGNTASGADLLISGQIDTNRRGPGHRQIRRGPLVPHEHEQQLRLDHDQRRHAATGRWDRRPRRFARDQRHREQLRRGL